MAARERFNADAPYIVHPHAAAIHYEPLAAPLARQLANIRSLMRFAPNDEEFAWLAEQEHALQAEMDAAAVLPVPVRHIDTPRRDRPPRRVSMAYLNFNTKHLKGRR